MMKEQVKIILCVYISKYTKLDMSPLLQKPQFKGNLILQHVFVLVFGFYWVSFGRQPPLKFAVVLKTQFNTRGSDLKFCLDSSYCQGKNSYHYLG